MFLPFKKLTLTFLFNSSLFVLLMIGIQNSSNKSKVNLLINESVALPLSFIIGTSFISGSILGSLINLDLQKSEK